MVTGFYKELLETMQNEEILSIAYARCVGIKGNQVIAGGEVIDILNTNAKVKVLWDELMDEAGIQTMGAEFKRNIERRT